MASLITFTQAEAAAFLRLIEAARKAVRDADWMGPAIVELRAALNDVTGYDLASLAVGGEGSSAPTGSAATERRRPARDGGLLDGADDSSAPAQAAAVDELVAAARAQAAAPHWLSYGMLEDRPLRALAHFPAGGAEPSSNTALRLPPGPVASGETRHDGSAAPASLDRCPHCAVGWPFKSPAGSERYHVVEVEVGSAKGGYSTYVRCWEGSLVRLSLPQADGHAEPLTCSDDAEPPHRGDVDNPEMRGRE